jgi:hypothetical protein
MTCFRKELGKVGRALV